ncbi:MAG: hypothetical protein JNM93_02420 [Bacteriovoracaceae bacterium]|nr:hypothetical protein [Bacteriovoracaceae bacterium]
MKYKNLSDLQKIQTLNLTPKEIRNYLREESFFKSPEEHEPGRRQHSEIIDQILKFQIKKIENDLVVRGKIANPYGNYKTWGPELHQGVQSWVGLDPRTLQTPYATLLEFLKALDFKDGQKFIDFGAAYGRVGILVGALYPQSFFVGYEIAKERVDEGNRIFQLYNFKNATLEHTNLADQKFEYPEADAYFIYDYGQEKHITYTLEQLRSMAKKREIKIVARGNITKHCLKDFTDFYLINEQLGIYKMEATEVASKI